MRRLVAFCLLSILVAVPGASAQPCPPDDCLPVVPFLDVPYLTGNVEFNEFAAHITIRDAVAQTDLTLRLANPGANATQSLISVPLPDGGTLLGFNLTIGLQIIEGRVAEKAQAQQEYNEAVEEGRDAAILEQASKRLVSLRVNVGPGEERVLRASYAEVVPVAAGSRVYRLPLAQLDPRPATVELSVEVQDHLGTANLRAPDQPLTFAGQTGVSRIEPTSPLQNLTVVWKPEGLPHIGLVAAGDPEAGWTEYLATFCLDAPALLRDVVFVVDQSGSMRGLKIDEARETLQAAIRTVTPQDKFGIVAFSSDVTPYQTALLPGTPSNIQSQSTRVAALAADGSTNLDGGLQEGFAQLAAANSPGRIPLLVLLSDGLPTAGETDHQQIIQRAKAANTRHAPVIVVPIGLDADYTFLADLALQSGGAYVDLGRPDAALSDHLSRLADVLARPVLAEPQLAVTGADVDAMYPRVLPPIFQEDCLDIRFRAKATADLGLTLSGTGANGPTQIAATFAPGSVPIQPAVRALWGQAVVADLLSLERADAGNATLHRLVVETAIELRQLSPHTAWVLTAPALVSQGDGQGAQGGIAASPSPAPSPPLAAPFVRDATGPGAQHDGGTASKTPALGAGAALGLLLLALLRRR